MAGANGVSNEGDVVDSFAAVKIANAGRATIHHGKGIVVGGNFSNDEQRVLREAIQVKSKKPVTLRFSDCNDDKGNDGDEGDDDNEFSGKSISSCDFSEEDDIDIRHPFKGRDGDSHGREKRKKRKKRRSVSSQSLEIPSNVDLDSLGGESKNKWTLDGLENEDIASFESKDRHHHRHHHHGSSRRSTAKKQRNCCDAANCSIDGRESRHVKTNIPNEAPSNGPNESSSHLNVQETWRDTINVYQVRRDEDRNEVLWTNRHTNVECGEQVDKYRELCKCRTYFWRQSFDVQTSRALLSAYSTMYPLVFIHWWFEHARKKFEKLKGADGQLSAEYLLKYDFGANLCEHVMKVIEDCKISGTLKDMVKINPFNTCQCMNHYDQHIANLYAKTMNCGGAIRFHYFND